MHLTYITCYYFLTVEDNDSQFHLWSHHKCLAQHLAPGERALAVLGGPGAGKGGRQVSRPIRSIDCKGQGQVLSRY